MKVSVVVKVQPPGGVLVLEILHVQPIDELFGEADQIASAIVPRGSTGPIRSEERRRTLESWPLVASSRGSMHAGRGMIPLLVCMVYSRQGSQP